MIFAFMRSTRDFAKKTPARRAKKVLARADVRRGRRFLHPVYQVKRHRLPGKIPVAAASLVRELARRLEIALIR